MRWHGITRLPTRAALGGLIFMNSVVAGDAAEPVPPAERQSWAPPAHVTPGEVGAPGLRVERGYARSALGQVHYQDVGVGPPVILLHQVPWFHIYYTRAQAELAARGFRTIAIDTPGYGLSARPDRAPAIADYAAAIDAVMRQLRVPRAVIVGHHTGSTIGAELARQYPRRVRCLVMHGVPLYTPAEAKSRLESQHWDQTYKPEGGHLTDRWIYLDGRIAGSLESKQWSVFALFLAGEKEWYGHHAVFKYDMKGALEALKVPVVVVSNGADLLDYTFERVRALRPDFTFQHLDGKSSNMAFDEPREWVDGVLSGVNSACGA
jgi:pimeloyl-ACP methyl ester carboxylesterase